MIALGGSGIRVLPVGLGTWSWGDRGDWGFGRTHDEADLREAFLASTARGCILVDTAEKYGGGDAERFLGRFVAGAGRPVAIATKFSPTRWQLGRAELFRALRASLGRLGRTSVDLYQLHWPTRFSTVAGRMEAMADAVEEGLVRAVGVANFSRDQVLRAHDVLARRGIPLATAQVEFNLLNREAETGGLLRACAERGVALVAYSPLASGVLTGKYGPGNVPPGWRGERYGPDALARAAGLLKLLRELAADHRSAPAAVALAWLRARGALAIPGAKNRRQAEENLASLELALSSRELDSLAAAAERVPAPERSRAV